MKRIYLDAKLTIAILGTMMFGSATAPAQQSSTRTNDDQTITLTANEDKKTIEVSVDSKRFTTFSYGGDTKPYLHPVLGPSGLRMTRDFPMKETIGEANDHPHHKSIWIGHEINGLDFWANKGGTIEVTETPRIDKDARSFVAKSDWIAHDGKTICRDETRWTFGADQKSRWIDCEFTLIACEGLLEINDTKEGTVAIRTHPSLRLKPDVKRGVEKVFGKAFNSTGTQGPSIWGQSAAWVAYTGQIDSRPASMLLLDHPKNFRHPTTWHARDYGLVAANPFGLTAFQNSDKGAGAVTLAKGQQITLRYRFQFFSEIIDAQQCTSALEDFCDSKR